MSCQNLRKNCSKKYSRKRGNRDKICLVCYSEFTYSPTVSWHYPEAVPKEIRKKEKILKKINNTTKEDFLTMWGKHKEIICNYQVILHKSNRKSHSLCLDCAIVLVMTNFEEFDDRLFKGLNVDDFILCYKSECDKVQKKDIGIICKQKINIETIHLLFPPIPIGALEGFDRITKTFRGFDFNKYDELPNVIKIISSKFLKIFNSLIPKRRCIEKDCSGIMILDEVYKYQRWICEKSLCKAELCCECNANHYQMTCQEFRRSTILDNETRKILEKEINDGKAKHCPKCNQIVQKDGGCNHMTCYLCETHFCWVCLWTPSEKINEFDVNPIYKHMSTEHNGYYND